MQSSRRQTANRQGDLETQRSILWCPAYKGPAVSARSVQSVRSIWTRNILLWHKFHKIHWCDWLNKVGQELGWNLENNPIWLRSLAEQVGWDFSTYKTDNQNFQIGNWFWSSAFYFTFTASSPASSPHFLLTTCITTQLMCICRGGRAGRTTQIILDVLWKDGTTREQLSARDTCSSEGKTES